MQNPIMGSTGVQHESQLAHDSSYDNSWVNINPYPQSTMAGYGNAEFAYIPPITTHGLSTESMTSMHSTLQPNHSPQQRHIQDQLGHQDPSQQQSQQQTAESQHQQAIQDQQSNQQQQSRPPSLPQGAHHHLPQLPMLMVPSNPTWPSMLTNPSNNYSAPAPTQPPPPPQPQPQPQPQQSVNIAPRESPKTSTPPTKTRSGDREGKPNHRKMLTDDDRRRMCEYSERNPGVKQADIGSLFGVERSTVSKVLRNKDRYISKEDRSKSPNKKPKGSRGMGSPSLAPMDRSLNASQSPVSPGGHPTGSPLSGHPGDDSTDTRAAAAGGYMDFSRSNSSPNAGHVSQAGHGGGVSMGGTMGLGMAMGGMGVYRHGSNQSTTSLTSVFTETPVSSFPGSALSPIVPFTFSPDSNVGSFLPSDAMAPPGSANFQRPRSQTLPALNLEYVSHAQNPQQQPLPQMPSHLDPMTTQAPQESMTPKYHHQVPSTAPSSTVDSPMTDISAPSYGIDSTVVSPQLRRSSSSNSLLMGAPRSAGGLAGAISGLTTNGGGSSPNSPTQDDARRAADTLLSFIQSVPSNFDHAELMAVFRLTEKLRLQHHHQQQVAKATVAASQSMRGLSRIPEGDVEMINDTNHLKIESTMTA